jgi:hypothetical protein
MLIDVHSEWMARNGVRRWIWKNLDKPRWCTSFVLFSESRVKCLLIHYRPGDNRHAPRRCPLRKSLISIVIWDWSPRRAVDNIVAALEHNDRVCEIELGGVPSLLTIGKCFDRDAGATRRTDISCNFGPKMTMRRQSFRIRSRWICPAPRLTAISRLELPSIFGITETSVCHSPRHSSPLDISHSGYISPNAILPALSA